MLTITLAISIVFIAKFSATNSQLLQLETELTNNDCFYNNKKQKNIQTNKRTNKHKTKRMTKRQLDCL